MSRSSRWSGPEGATGYVMKLELNPASPKLYVKLELTASRVIGRSFHLVDPLSQRTHKRRN